ncbi:hypothetical protein HYS48_04620, partial [Candidatus Woesearchaeota archaeon]|nr:hypothetical protein [Candidatus Woesearchaeota archaeon]
MKRDDRGVVRRYKKLMQEHWKYVVILLLLSVCIAASLRLYTGRLQNMVGNSDMNILLALQHLTNDPALYSKDVGIQTIAAVYPKPVNILIAKTMLFLGDMRPAYLFWNFLLYLLFILGLYAFAYHISKSKAFSFVYG